MTCGIYMIKNKRNDKVYIGKSKNIEQRWKEHINMLNNHKHHCYKLQEDWNLFNEDSFEFLTLQSCPEESLTENENKWIHIFNAKTKGYNTDKDAPKYKERKENKVNKLMN